MKFELPPGLRLLTPEESAAEKLAADRSEREIRIAEVSACLTARDVDAVVDARLEETKTLADVRAWISKSSSPVLVLASGPGRGKTVACAWLLAERGGFYVACEDFVRIAGAKFGAEADRFARLRGCATLVLDDVGRESDADIERMRAALVELVDRRQGERTKTVICTNLPRSAMADRYQDDRLMSRLDQSAIWRTDTGPDLRRRK